MSDNAGQSVVGTRDTIKPMQELMRQVLAVPKEDVDKAMEAEKVRSGTKGIKKEQ